jgi:predicted DNA-binding transcriptional regulator AlpA
MYSLNLPRNIGWILRLKAVTFLCVTTCPEATGSAHAQRLSMDSPASPGRGYVEILRLPEVCRASGLGRSMVYQLAAAKRFPRRITIGQRAVGWIEAGIQSWLAERIAVSRGSLDLPVERSNSARRFAPIFARQVSPR